MAYSRQNSEKSENMAITVFKEGATDLTADKSATVRQGSTVSVSLEGKDASTGEIFDQIGREEPLSFKVGDGALKDLWE